MIQQSHRRRFRNSFSNVIVDIQTVKSRTVPPGVCLWNLFCIKLGYFNLVQIQYEAEVTEEQNIADAKEWEILERSHNGTDGFCCWK